MKKNLESIRLAGLLFCLTPVAAAVAQTAAPVDSLTVAAAPEAVVNDEAYRVVVTGARAPVALKDTPQRIEVVTRQEIRETPHRELADLLGKTTNVDIKRYPGMNGSVGMRGFTPSSPMTGESMQTLVLQNGLPAVNNNISFMPVNGVARVEVMKGPASSLYGSQAMSGVINVIPVRRTGDIQGGVGVSAGNHNLRQVEADIGGAINETLNFDYFGNWEKRGDYKDGHGQTMEFSGYKQHSHGLRLGAELAPGWTLDARADLFRANDVQNPGPDPEIRQFETSKDADRDLYSLTLQGKVDQHTLSAAAYTGKENYLNYDLKKDGRLVQSYDSRIKWHGLQLKDEWDWAEGYKLVFGYDYNQTKASARSGTPPWTFSYNPDSKLKTHGLYAQQNISLNEGRTNLYVGGRYDRITMSTLPTDGLGNVTQSRDFSQFSPSAGIKHELAPGISLHASAGKGFSAPSAWKLSGEYSGSDWKQDANGNWYPVPITYVGNANLDPESSVSVDAGIGFERDNWNMDLTLYHTRIKDKIVAYDVSPGLKSWRNADEARMRGLELAGNWQFNSNLRLDLGYTHSFRSEQRNGSVWSPLEYVPKNTVRAALVGNWDKLHARLGARYNGKSWKSRAERGGYTLWDMSLGYAINKHHTLSLSVDNLFDRYYEEVHGYNMPGREIRVGYRWNFR
ncbi:TonB-dependent receptor [Brachymonas denitrificans]|uniref:TonB-dependent receptor plug domain-containing protein n=1 Tax=Brachymonas denitrificans TaxID=28220 RepID=UPI002AFFFEE7|nr:TonB-dependent receptor [Brachymonas denitrificans]